MLQRIDLNLRCGVCALLLDLLDHLQNTLHIATTTLDNHNPHFRNKGDINVTDQPCTASNRIRGSHSHPRSIVVIACCRYLTHRLIILRRLLIRSLTHQTQSRLNTLGTCWIDRNNLSRTLRIRLRKIHRRYNLRPSKHILRTTLHTHRVGATIHRHDLPWSCIGKHLQLSQLAVVGRRYRQTRSRNTDHCILKFSPTNLLKLILAGLNRIGKNATCHIRGNRTCLLVDRRNHRSNLLVSGLRCKHHQTTRLRLSGNPNSIVIAILRVQLRND